jgi:hypothetical protein
MKSFVAAVLSAVHQPAVVVDDKLLVFATNEAFQSQFSSHGLLDHHPDINDAFTDPLFGMAVKAFIQYAFKSDQLEEDILLSQDTAYESRCMLFEEGGKRYALLTLYARQQFPLGLSHLTHYNEMGYINFFEVDLVTDRIIFPQGLSKRWAEGERYDTLQGWLQKVQPAKMEEMFEAMAGILVGKQTSCEFQVVMRRGDSDIVYWIRHDVMATRGNAPIRLSGVAVDITSLRAALKAQVLSEGVDYHP